MVASGTFEYFNAVTPFTNVMKKIYKNLIPLSSPTMTVPNRLKKAARGNHASSVGAIQKPHTFPLRGKAVRGAK
jgi:predicted translin family RNA/ssDNA-binding protein